MSRSIRLWRPRQTRTSDDAGITILKCTLPQVPPKASPYELATSGRERPSYLPSLTYFCIQALLDYPDQVHTLGPLRLTYRPPENPEAHDILRELIPFYRQGQPLDLMQVDPRLWAVLVQLYDDLPAQLRVYTLPLADRYLLSLQRIPPTASFALVTVLELPGCKELTDENVVLLKGLHNLCAFDASGTALSAWSVKTLAKTLTITEEDEGAGTGPGVYRRGPWGLRILSLRNCMNVNNEVFECLTMFPLLSVVDVRGTRCKSTSRAAPFRPCEHAELFYPTTPSKALLFLASPVAGEQCSLFSHPKPYILEVRGLDYGRSSGFPQPTGTITSASDAPSIGSRQDVFLLSPRYRQQTEATGASLNRLMPRNSCSCLGCANHGPCERQPDTMVDVASEEVLLEARRGSVRRFYESGPHGPAAIRPTSRARACKPEDKPFMLYRSPPSWNSLPSLDLLKANADDTERKKVKLDAPLADGRTLSTDGVRERAEVNAAVTALHTSLKERQVLLAATNASQGVSNRAETIRRISSNPFARSAKASGKAKMHSECQGPAVVSTTPLSKKASGSRLDLTPASSEALTPKVKPLKPISQLRVPSPPPQIAACGSLPHNWPTQQFPKHPGTKSSQTTITSSLLADSQRRASSGLTTKGSSTSKPKGGPVPKSPGSKGKPASAAKSKSGTFDWMAWGIQTSNGDSRR
ncbi:hypothetical protein DAEQUDRAFT_812282 [Daedalea quercina L-15889]|uniref:Uncharacterized protein n=1 Tax=Daedalea quercina L-15889 TaxID=1314783 RepID=A0A165PEQ2_9APHY|nr:hypothetical protein DAEQUDRAFT_812282 [Daedalea quercina L-15889]